MRILKKCIIASLIATGVVFAAGCGLGTDKFVGDWGSEANPTIEKEVFFKNNVNFDSIPRYYDVHIEKNDKSYLVSCKEYSYRVYQDKMNNKKSGVKYNRIRDLYIETWGKGTSVSGDSVKADGTPIKPGDKDIVQAETGTVDYKIDLLYQKVCENSVASLENKESTLSVKSNGWPIMQCDYISKDDSLKLTFSSGGSVILKKNKGSEVEKYVTYVKETVQKLIADRDNEIKEVAASGSTALPSTYLSGTVTFNEDVLNKK